MNEKYDEWWCKNMHGRLRYVHAKNKSSGKSVNKDVHDKENSNGQSKTFLIGSNYMERRKTCIEETMEKVNLITQICLDQKNHSNLQFGLKWSFPKNRAGNLVQTRSALLRPSLRRDGL